MTTEPIAPRMSGPDAVDVYTRLVEAGVDCWVVGGWGVDALVGHETRPHHDLDILVARADLGLLLRALLSFGFTEKLIWQESVWIDVDGEPRPSAFVQIDHDGRELDVHVLDLTETGNPAVIGNVPWTFTEHEFEASGVIAGTTVRCVSAATQLQMHAGYDLPAAHRTDVQHLLRLTRS